MLGRGRRMSWNHLCGRSGLAFYWYVKTPTLELCLFWQSRTKKGGRKMFWSWYSADASWVFAEALEGRTRVTNSRILDTIFICFWWWWASGEQSQRNYRHHLLGRARSAPISTPSSSRIMGFLLAVRSATKSTLLTLTGQGQAGLTMPCSDTRQDEWYLQ